MGLQEGIVTDATALEQQIAAACTTELARELFGAYEEMRKRYFRRDHRPGQLEAGRFAEAAFRVLQINATGRFTPVGNTLPKVPELMRGLEAADGTAVHESVRVHIPRALAVIYNVRNRRDVGHIAADVDANEMDAEMVMAVCNWVLAEFVRLFHRCSPAEAQAYVGALVKRQAPLVQVFGERPSVLAPNLTTRDEIMLLLYHQADTGASLQQLDEWMRGVDRKVITARISELELKHRYVVRFDGRFVISDTGVGYAETKLIPKMT
jgi:hypothetical protein